ncbi:MAG: glycosyltransferase, partial [Solirubrobacterales bacterium]|nr:glycosyltransferase [Solirubrobacterales bacterium]
YARRAPDPTAPIIASFGVLSEVKGLATLLDAFALVASDRPGARLTLLGPADEPELTRWRSRADDLGIGGQVSIPGYGDAQTYEDLLRDATVAVQLRTITNGEASAAVCDCLGAGLPTIVTGLGWADELPADAVARVPIDVSAIRLAGEISAVLDDREHREKLAREASAYAHRTTYADVAQRYIEVLGFD